MQANRKTPDFFSGDNMINNSIKPELAHNNGNQSEGSSGVSMSNGEFVGVGNDSAIDQNSKLLEFGDQFDSAICTIGNTRKKFAKCDQKKSDMTR